MKKSNTKPENNYKEFNFEAKNNFFSGRIYTEGTKSEKATRFGLSLTINGLAIIGCKLFVTENKTFVAMPTYKTSGGEYKNLCFFTDKEDLKDLDNLASHLKSLLEEF